MFLNTCLVLELECFKNFTSRKKVECSGYETKHYSISASCVRIDVEDQSANHKKILALF